MATYYGRKQWEDRAMISSSVCWPRRTEGLLSEDRRPVPMEMSPVLEEERMIYGWSGWMQAGTNYGIRHMEGLPMKALAIWRLHQTEVVFLPEPPPVRMETWSPI